MSATREHIVSRTLMTGILLSGSMMLIGFLLYAFQPSYHDAAIPVATWAWLRKLWHLPLSTVVVTPWVFLYAGILLLMATPVVRIVITGWTFWQEREMRYVWISVIVLAVIGVSIVFSVTH
jgi:uncharacterized membrane protein